MRNRQSQSKHSTPSKAPQLLQSRPISLSPARTSVTKASTAPVPPHATLDELRAAAAHCRACDLWKTGTQTVFGEGSRTAKVMFVGEPPGDREDLAGHPFVGPAGRLLDRGLEQASIDRGEVYVTNVVNHFKWVRDERGKRRIHKKPNASEIHACRPWLDAELAVIKPQVLVCPGGYCCPGTAGKKFQCEPAERTIDPVESGSLLNGYCASFRFAANA